MIRTTARRRPLLLCLFALALSLAACAGNPAAPEAATSADAPAAHAAAHGAHEGHDHAGHEGHGHHGHFAKRFDDAETWAEHFDHPEREAWQKPAEVVRLLGAIEGATVVDLGAGTGYFLPWLAEAVGPEGRVLALDLEASMVEYLTARAAREGLSNVEARQVESDDPGLEPASADRILVVNTWHHIPERAAYSSKLAQGLRPGGQVVVVDFTVDARRGPPANHRLPPEVVAAELEAGGLVPSIVADESLPDQYVVIGQRPE